MSDKREMSDLEYHESGQAKQDLYDELMRARDHIARLEARVKAMDDVVNEADNWCRLHGLATARTYSAMIGVIEALAAYRSALTASGGSCNAESPPEGGG